MENLLRTNTEKWPHRNSLKDLRRGKVQSPQDNVSVHKMIGKGQIVSKGVIFVENWDTCKKFGFKSQNKSSPGSPERVNVVTARDKSLSPQVKKT